MAVPLETLERVQFTFNAQLGFPHYAPFRHPGNPPRYPPFDVQLPIMFMARDISLNSVVCFLHPLQPDLVLTTAEHTQDPRANIGLCRCGVVRLAVYFQRKVGTNTSGSNVVSRQLAIKIMDKDQLNIQHDDVANEVRVMAHLQHPGLGDVERESPHFSCWECDMDAGNQYIAMDLAANGSIIQYANRRLKEYKHFAVRQLVQVMTDMPRIDATVNAFAAIAWMQEALHLYAGIMHGLVFMHSRHVCHLDLDPCNVVVDSTYTPRLIDFGSSEVMNADGFAGGGDRLIKFKPLYVPPEVRDHNHHAEPRPPFLGAPADMWSAGVLLYQLLCFGYPKGHLALICDPTNWRNNLLCHAIDDFGECLGEQGCLICFRHIEFPPVIYEIFRGLLAPTNPAERLSAATVEEMLQPLVQGYDDDFEHRCQSLLATLI